MPLAPANITINQTRNTRIPGWWWFEWGADHSLIRALDS
jgi:hypothetical protein